MPTFLNNLNNKILHKNSPPQIPPQAITHQSRLLQLPGELRMEVWETIILNEPTFLFWIQQFMAGPNPPPVVVGQSQALTAQLMNNQINGEVSNRIERLAPFSPPRGNYSLPDSSQVVPIPVPFIDVLFDVHAPGNPKGFKIHNLTARIRYEETPRGFIILLRTPPADATTATPGRPRTYNNLYVQLGVIFRRFIVDFLLDNGTDILQSADFLEQLKQTLKAQMKAPAPSGYPLILHCKKIRVVKKDLSCCALRGKEPKWSNRAGGQWRKRGGWHGWPSNPL